MRQPPAPLKQAPRSAVSGNSPRCWKNSRECRPRLRELKDNYEAELFLAVPNWNRQSNQPRWTCGELSECARWPQGPMRLGAWDTLPGMLNIRTVLTVWPAPRQGNPQNTNKLKQPCTCCRRLLQDAPFPPSGVEQTIDSIE
jgi:hypothetical protein